MFDDKKRDTRSREHALAESIRHVVAELRLVDVVDYVAFLRLERHGNIADIVSSSAELYLKPGVLRYAGSGEVRLSWGTVPVVALSLEFSHAGVDAHFRLEMGAAAAAVDITFIDFRDGYAEGRGDTERLLAAVLDAHLKPVVPASLA